VEIYRATRQATANSIIRLMHTGRWISKAGIQTGTHNIITYCTEWLSERVLILRYTYTTCFVLVSFSWMPILTSLFYNFLDFCLLENKFLRVEVPFANF